MEDDYRMNSSRFVEKNSFSGGEIDDQCLFVRDIPRHLSKDAFQVLMSEGGKRPINVMLSTKGGKNDYTYGFAHFSSHREAENALKALNGSPPLYLRLSYANKRAGNGNEDCYRSENIKQASDFSYVSEIQNFNNRHSKGRGRGRNVKYSPVENGNSSSFSMKGRGIRIDLSGNKSISHKLKVCAGDDGRKVTMGSPEKPQQSTSCNKLLPKHSFTNADNHSSVGFSIEEFKRKDFAGPGLASNPFKVCFCCGKEAHHSCGNCKKPYCSSNCQIIDWPNHLYICKLARGVSESLIESFRSCHNQANDSSYMSESSNSDCEKYECGPAKSLQSVDCSPSQSELKKLNGGLIRTPKKAEKRAIEEIYLSPDQVEKDEKRAIEKVPLSAGQVEKVLVVNIESLSKFWIQLQKFSETLLKMEKDLSLIPKTKISYLSPDLICCCSHDDKVYRAKIIKENSLDEALVYLLDYGKKVTVTKYNIFLLPHEFRKLPAQAVCCKLVDDAVKDIQWSSDALLSFQFYAVNKSFKAYVLKCCDGVNEVSLINEDGITLYSILAEEKNALACIDEVSPPPPPSQIESAPPSILTRLKLGVEMTVVPVIVSNESARCYLSADNGADLNDLLQIEELLLNYSEEDITMYSEEGDFAAGFSPEYKQFYRCMVLKRKQKSFLVRYIDYGNDEEVTRLNALSPELLKKYCYTVKLEKPPSISGEDFSKFLGSSDIKVTVNKIEKNMAELAFSFHKQHTMQCYSIYSEKSVKTIADSAVKCDIIPSPKQEVEHNYKDLAQKILAPKMLSLNKAYSVKVAFISDVSQVFVQLAEDEKRINLLLKDLNSYCNANVVSSGYVPNIGEIVCCQYTDGIWYRGEVKNKIKDKFQVSFLDYGNEDTVSQRNVQKLPVEFSFPKFSICVSFSEIENSDISKHLLAKLLDEIWILKVINNERFPNQVMLFQNNISLIDLIKNESNNNVIALKTLETTVESVSKQENHPVLEKKQLSISSLKQQYLKDGINKVMFCYAENDINYCQLYSDKQNVLDLFEKLQTFSKVGESPTNSYLSVGDVVCGKSSDGFWYRASIVSDHKSPEHKVFFFDYGNKETLTIDCLKILPEEFLAHPIFAIPTKIKNIQEISDPDIFLKPVIAKKICTSPRNIQIIEVHGSTFSMLDKKLLPPNTVSKVTVCHVEESTFYVQPASEENELSKLINILQEAQNFDKVLDLPDIGDLVCAKFSDGVWYRSCVKQIFEDKQQIIVHFLDYGNTHKVPLSDIRVLPPELYSYPVLCVPVKFKTEMQETVENNLLQDIYTFHIKVVGLDGDIQVIDIIPDSPDKAFNLIIPDYESVYISSFKRSTLSNQETGKLVFKANEGNFYFGLKLVDFDEIKKLSAILQETNTKIISHEPRLDEVLLVKRSDKLWHRCSVKEILSDGSIKVFFVDLGITDDILKSELHCLPENCISFPLFAVKVMVKTEQPVTLEKTYFIKVLEQNADSSITVEVYHQFMFSAIERKQLPLNEECSVIFCHKENDILFLQNIPDSDTIAEVQNELSKCSNTCLIYKPAVGELVCAMSQSDNSWYRGCIEELLSTDRYKIHFIDYGNCEVVSKQHLQQIPSFLTKIPSLCIPVKLANMSFENIELDKVYSVVAETEPSNNVQIIRIVDTEENVKDTQIFDNSANISETKCKYSALEYVKFNSGEQDIVMYNVDEGGSAFCAPFDQNNISANIELSKMLTEFCVNGGSVFADDGGPKSDDLVLAKYSGDGQWYRAVVVEKRPPLFEVTFIDYGNSEEVHRSCLRKMEEQFMTLPIQAHFCSFIGFTVNEGKLPEVIEELMKFTIFSCSEPLRAHVQMHESEVTINVPSITAALVEKNLATLSE